MTTCPSLAKLPQLPQLRKSPTHASLPLLVAALLCVVILSMAGAGGLSAQQPDPDRSARTAEARGESRSEESAREESAREEGGREEGGREAGDRALGLIPRPEVLPGSFSVGAAKWGSLAFSLGSASYGFILNRRADRAFRPLEGHCTRKGSHCSVEGRDGSLLNPGLESDFQRVRSLDGSARTAFVAGQIGLGAAVLLFILDLAGSDTPDVIPFEVPHLRLDGNGAGWEAHIPVGGK